jgi:hypothetical protein
VRSDEQLQGDGILRRLVESLPQQDRIARTRMFSGAGYALDGRIFAFIGRTGRLIAKVEASSAQDKIARGEAGQVTMGTRTMREWIGLELDEVDAWPALVTEAFEYADSPPPASPITTA